MEDGLDLGGASSVEGSVQGTEGEVFKDKKPHFHMQR